MATSPNILIIFLVSFKNQSLRYEKDFEATSNIIHYILVFVNMLQSLRLSRLMIRLGLAVVFLWFGIDKFFHPQYWVDAWVPASVIAIFAKIGISDINFIYLNGIFELLVATSLLTDLFVRMFSIVAIVFLCSIFIFYGFNEALIRDIGLVGAFLALVFWPERNYL